MALEDDKAKAARIKALQDSVKARLAAARNNQSTAKKRPREEPQQNRILALQNSVQERLAEAQRKKQKKAQVFDVDFSQTKPSFKDGSAQDTGKVNPYLAHTTAPVIKEPTDARLEQKSAQRPRRELKFVEPGHYTEKARVQREKEVHKRKVGYLSGRKGGTATTGLEAYTDAHEEDEAEVVHRADANPDTKMPLFMEWWDAELLPAELRQRVADLEAKSYLPPTKKTKEDEVSPEQVSELRSECEKAVSISNSKTSALVQHIVPVIPSTADRGPPKEPVLHLTKKDRKRLRKQRREKKQRELQDLQAAGLIPAPEPRLTLKNFMQVLGDQAVLDPSQMEQKVQEQMQARQKAHEQRNLENKLTDEQRKAKQARKYEEETLNLNVAIFFVKDMSHPYHRAKVDLNAQQFNLAGCVLECAEDPSFAIVIVEGGPKNIKRYTRLMTVRMKWTGPEEVVPINEDDEEETRHKFNLDNYCRELWQGMATKHSFRGFQFHACDTHGQARKMLRGRGIEHYWEQAVQVANGNTGDFKITLT